MIDMRMGSVKDVASALGVDYSTVIHLIDAGEIAAVDLAVYGKKRRLKVRWSSVEAFVCRRKVQPKTPKRRSPAKIPYRRIV